MKMKISLFVIILYTSMIVDALAQDMPLVYDVEHTGADCPEPYLPSFGELPPVQALPDPFAWSDGRGRISNFSDWRYRRAEIKTEIEYYEIGEKPVRPDSISASYAGGTLTVNITVNGNTLTLTSAVNLPSGDGPFPAVIGMGSSTGSLPSDIFTSRDIATVTFNFWQVMAHTQTRGSEPINTLYPDLTYIGAYSAWSWGVSRLIDGLELVAPDLDIDLKHLAVTGCSFAGKMALFAGAFDERIALTIAQESGGGGYTTWRVSETLGNVETLAMTSHAWFIEDLFQFSNAVSKLPYDHHELMAMVAPRALFVTGNPDYEWLADESGHVGSKAAKDVWNALGIPDRFGYSISGDHSHCQVPDSQILEIEAFVEKFLLGNESVNTDIATSPYNTNLSPWINWITPVLANDTSYFGKASFIHPSNFHADLDTSITFMWHKVKDAQKYYFQLSTDPTFKYMAIDDSTTDTVKTVTGLLKGKRYYWRIQAKNSAGLLGPWSNQWNFSTSIDLPGKTHLVAATPIPNRSDYINLTWRKVKDTDQYSIQVSVFQNFSRVLLFSSTQDTVINLKGTSEGQKYYWRIQAVNIAGAGPWSEVWDFTIIIAPTNLVLQRSALNEITLSWKDLSAVEDGYVIERKQSEETFFLVIDTLKGSGNAYVDKIEEVDNYTYRVKAYKDSAESAYSNEATITLTGITGEEGVPTEYSISQNYPNPFNPITKVKFGLPKRALTKIIIYDLLGREIQTPINENLEAGYHEVYIDANHWPSGVYFYTFQAGDFIQAKKMILTK